MGAVGYQWRRRRMDTLHGASFPCSLGTRLVRARRSSPPGRHKDHVGRSAGRAVLAVPVQAKPALGVASHPALLTIVSLLLDGRRAARTARSPKPGRRVTRAWAFSGENRRKMHGVGIGNPALGRGLSLVKTGGRCTVWGSGTQRHIALGGS
jgi:hypothetical protein